MRTEEKEAWSDSGVIVKPRGSERGSESDDGSWQKRGVRGLESFSCNDLHPALHRVQS